MKKLILHVSMRGVEKKKGDEELVRAWKDHNIDCRLIHHKIELIVSQLGL